MHWLFSFVHIFSVCRTEMIAVGGKVIRERKKQQKENDYGGTNHIKEHAPNV